MAHLDELLTPCITCVEFDRREARELCTQMCTSGLAYAWWARDHNATEVVHAILAGFLEIGFQTA